MEFLIFPEADGLLLKEREEAPARSFFGRSGRCGCCFPGTFLFSEEGLGCIREAPEEARPCSARSAGRFAGRFPGLFALFGRLPLFGRFPVAIDHFFSNIPETACMTASFTCSNTRPPCIYTRKGGLTGPSAENSIDAPCTKAPAAMTTCAS